MTGPGSAGSGLASAEEIERWQQELSQKLPQLPPELLDPSLLPVALLRDPSQWTPEDDVGWLRCSSGLPPKIYTDPKHLLSSGRLAEIALGQRSMFTDLPPVHLQAYRDGLRPVARQGDLSALEHLAGIGRQRFQRGRPLGMDLDRYQPPVTDQHQADPPLNSLDPGGSPPNPTSSRGRVGAQLTPRLGEKGGAVFGTPPSKDPYGWMAAPPTDSDSLISFCHASDQWIPGSAAHCPLCGATPCHGLAHQR